MDVQVRAYCPEDAGPAVEIWNSVVEDGLAFPQMDCLDEDTGRRFFAGQSDTGIAYDRESCQVLGLYILHSNNEGRCGHICSASYAVRRDLRGRHVGERLVTDSLARAKEAGFRIMQFNAVVASNRYALRLYKKLGFVQLGTIPGGFLSKDGHYEDIIVHYHLL